MSKKIVQLNEEVIKVKLKELVRNSVQETLNDLLEKEAQELTQAARMSGQSPGRYHSGHYSRNLTNDLRRCGAEGTAAEERTV